MARSYNVEKLKEFLNTLPEGTEEICLDCGCTRTNNKLDYVGSGELLDYNYCYCDRDD